MDRSDEKRDDRIDDHRDSVEVPSTLGIGRANPPRDHVPSREEGHSLEETETESRPGAREIQRSPGATSIDMGSGGTGTEIERP